MDESQSRGADVGRGLGPGTTRTEIVDRTLRDTPPPAVPADIVSGIYRHCPDIHATGMRPPLISVQDAPSLLSENVGRQRLRET